MVLLDGWLIAWLLLGGGERLRGLVVQVKRLSGYFLGLVLALECVLVWKIGYWLLLRKVLLNLLLLVSSVEDFQVWV